MFAGGTGGDSTTSENRPYAVPETGRTGFFKAYYSPLFDQQNRIVGGIAAVHDITERKRVEEEAQEAHQRLTFHVESSPLAVIEWDSDFRVSRWSASAERLFGWKAEEVLGKHVNEWHFVFDEDVDAVAQVTNRQREGVEVQGVQRNRNYTRGWFRPLLRVVQLGAARRARQTRFRALARARRHRTANSAEEERAAPLMRERDAAQACRRSGPSER